MKIQWRVLYQIDGVPHLELWFQVCIYSICVMINIHTHFYIHIIVAFSCLLFPRTGVFCLLGGVISQHHLSQGRHAIV